MKETEQERRFRQWQYWVAAIPYAVDKYRLSSAHPSESAVAKYEAGLWRYAKVLEHAASAHTLRKR